ncbi:MAG: hypothetical protein KC501_37245 [Myxococcales bacterium]|nr:hypothetical protein [Myxococcales bacterium]
MRRRARWLVLGLAGLAWAGGLACTPDLGKLGDVAEDPGGSEGGQLPPSSERTAVLRLDDGALDVLFVIDNSGSMGTEQARATVAIAEFARVATQTYGADLRLGFTTTDDGNPWCQGTTPEAGQLVLRACTGRLSEFVFEGAQTIDATEEACLELCDLDSVQTIGTATHLDSTLSPRPWIEVSLAGTNLQGAALEAAVLCTAPQGIAGCGFESPLEAMHAAITRSSSPSDPSYGFMRPWARLAVVFVTDEGDCSVDDAWEEIFLPDGNRVFWSDPQTPAPSSAVCWNAGVQCESDGPQLGACNPQNYDVNGNVTDATSAVMRSLTRYIEDLQAVEASKAAYRPETSVAVALIAGVPEGYGDGTAELVYTRGVFPDPQFLEDFGVDPGCYGPAGLAVPPVRLRVMAELHPVGDREVVYSVCRDAYSPAFDQLYGALATPRTERSACIPGCLVDVDSKVAGTQLECEVIMLRAGEQGREELALSPCEAGAVPDGEDACYLLRVDEDAAACAAQGSNAELELVLREGVELRGQLDVEVACDPAPGAC